MRETEGLREKKVLFIKSMKKMKREVRERMTKNLSVVNVIVQVCMMLLVQIVFIERHR